MRLSLMCLCPVHTINMSQSFYAVNGLFTGSVHVPILAVTVVCWMRTGATKSYHLPFVHKVSVVIHKVPAEGAKCTKLLKWDFFWHKHSALQNTNRAGRHQAMKTTHIYRICFTLI